MYALIEPCSQETSLQLTCVQTGAVDFPISNAVQELDENDMTTCAPFAADELGPTICVGEILVEIMATTTGNGFTKVQPLLGPYPSGAPAIFISQCARTGGRTAIIGAVGDDDFGALNIERLKADGVDVSGIHIDQELPTGSAFVRYRANGSRDFVYNIWTSAAGQICWTDVVERLAQQAGHLHVMGTLLSRPGIWETVEKIATIVKARGGSISLDPNIRKELNSSPDTVQRFNAMMRRSDLILPSGEELSLITGTDDQAKALDFLFSLGVREVALKKGAAGATVFTPSDPPFHLPGFQIQEVDPTGAGDCFGGAYVACRRLGMDVADSLTYANAAGARNASIRGPMEGAGNRQELDQFIQSKRFT